MSQVEYTPSVQVYIDEIARKLKDGKAAIMVGAGFSRNVAPNQSLPDWKDLGDVIFKGLNKTEPSDKDRFISVLRLAGEFEAVHGRNALDELLQKTIPDKQYEPSELHTKLLELPWADIFTTNYDTFLERARDNVVSRKYDLVLTKEDLVVSKSPRIVKLHGSFPSQRPFIVTEEDYRKYPQDYSFFVNTVQQSLVENLFCLIGFSGDDPNFLNWIGWIRDNFGKNFTPKIYLLGVGDVTESQRALLEQRNILPINLAKIDNDENDTISHAKAFEKFFEYLELSWKDSFFQWGESSKMSQPKNGLTYEKNCQVIINKWRETRLSYPGWIVLPYVRRNTLWSYTQKWLFHYKQKEYAQLPEEMQFEYTYELCWRLEKCLYPLLGEELVDRCDAFIQASDRWTKDRLNQWIEIALWLLREYRTDGKLGKWISTRGIVEKYLKQFPEEQRAKLCYEDCLYAIFSFDISLLKKKLISWPTAKDLPFWESKKAALYAEIGEMGTARKILESSLSLIRKLQNKFPENERIRYLSNERCITAISRKFETAESIVAMKYDHDAIQAKYEPRFQLFSEYQCSPKDESLIFSQGLKGEPAPFSSDSRTDTRHFDIGKMTHSYCFGNVNEDSLNGYSFLMFTEETGIPVKLPGITFDKASVLGAIRRISKYSFHWALVTFVRSGHFQEKEVDILLNREALASLTTEQIDFYIVSFIKAANEAKSDFENLPNATLSFNLGGSIAQITPEILSRLCARCSYESMLKMLVFLRDLYLCEKKSLHYKGVANLAKRLLSNWPHNKKDDLFTALLNIPYPKTEHPVIDKEYPDLWHFFNYDSHESFQFDEQVINDALEKIESADLDVRATGIAILNTLHSLSLLNGQQQDRLKVLLWARREPGTGFPLQSPERRLYNYAFLSLPYPKDVDVISIFKQYTLAEREEYFSDGMGQLQPSGISLTGGQSYLFEEWEGGYGFNHKNRVSLTKKETTDILHSLCSYWFEHKEVLNENATFHPFSIEEEFRNRFNRILRILALVVIPNLTCRISRKVKSQLQTLLSEMSNANLSNKAAHVAALAIFPEQFENSWDEYQKEFLVDDTYMAASAQLGIIVLLWMKANGKTTLDVDNQILLTPIVNSIKYRTVATLASSVDHFCIILDIVPDCIDEMSLKDVCLGLELLLSESNLANTNSSRIPDYERLLCRKRGMKLASLLYRYFLDQKKDIPAVILTWKQISESPDEFWEIRNAWKVDETINDC